MTMLNFFRLAVIIGTLPNTLTNGTVADATQVMADFNKIVNDVNANAAPLAGVALLAATNSFTMEQIGVSGTGQASYPTISQMQTWQMNTLGSVAGGNTVTANALGNMTGYTVGEVFTFYPASPNSGPVTLNINSIGAVPIHVAGAALGSNSIRTNRTVVARFDGAGTGFAYINAPSLIAGTACEINPIAVNSQQVTAHGLGGAPPFCVTELVCLTGELGYSAGDVVEMAVNNENTAGSCNVSVLKGAANLTITISNNVLPSIARLDTKAIAIITGANWKIRATPYRIS